MNTKEENSNELLREAMRSHERELSLLAYDLHDGLAQLIVGAKMHLEAINVNELERKNEKKISDAKKHLASAMSEIRKLVADLRAASFDPQTILLEIESLVQRSNTENLTISTSIDQRISRLAQERCTAIIRIIQESLNNIAKHSGAAQAVIKLRFTDQVVELFVADDGMGFDTEVNLVGSNKSTSTNQAFGLDGINFRANATGGTAKIISQPKQMPETKSEKTTSGIAESKELIESISDTDFQISTIVYVSWPL